MNAPLVYFFCQRVDDWMLLLSTALFTNIAAINQLNRPLRKQNFFLTGSKGHGLWLVIGGFRSVLCVSVFQGSAACDRNYDWPQRKMQLWRWLLNFRVRMFVKSVVKTTEKITGKCFWTKENGARCHSVLGIPGGIPAFWASPFPYIYH